ncbi:hypothetical protein MPER_11656, partial [Moniliophthora perniciosa FA553]
MSVHVADSLQAEEALYALAPLAAKYDEDGVDLYFLNNKKVQEIFSGVSRSSGTPLGRKLRELLSSYVTRYEKDKTIKPVMFLFITDGAPTDPEPENQTKTVILDFARKLDALNARLTQVGIQFLQVGDDENARRFLTSLDDNLKKEHDVRVNHPFKLDESYQLTPRVRTWWILPPQRKVYALDVVKALLGAINRRVDNQDEQMN